MITINFKDTYIKDWFSIGGVDEALSNVKGADLYLKDHYYGQKTFEDAEVKMIQTVVNNLEAKNKFNLIIGGNLSNQLGILNYAIKNNNKSFLGLYNACATFTESLIIASKLLENKNDICVITSSHEQGAEKQFRFPIEYESLKKKYSTITITACVGSILSKEKSKYKIISGTIGDIIDYDIKDVFNMGAVMAPSAAKTIINHLKNNKKSLNDYDLILTGDLGNIGIKILKKLLESEYKITNNIYDAGALIYENNPKKLAGGSGPAVLPYVFFNKYIKDKKMKKILIVGTGALHSPTTVNLKKSIPSVSHAVEIEVANV